MFISTEGIVRMCVCCVDMCVNGSCAFTPNRVIANPSLPVVVIILLLVMLLLQVRDDDDGYVSSMQRIAIVRGSKWFIFNVFFLKLVCKYEIHFN